MVKRIFHEVSARIIKWAFIRDAKCCSEKLYWSLKLLAAISTGHVRGVAKFVGAYPLLWRHVAEEDGGFDFVDVEGLQEHIDELLSLSVQEQIDEISTTPFDCIDVLAEKKGSSKNGRKIGRAALSSPVFLLLLTKRVVLYQTPQRLSVSSLTIGGMHFQVNLLI